jgi:hypothetical protein
MDLGAPEPVMLEALKQGQLESLETIYRGSRAEIQAGARLWRQAQAYSRAQYHPAVTEGGVFTTQQRAEMESFLKGTPEPQGRLAQQQGRTFAAMQTLGQAMGWTGAQGTGRRVVTAEDMANFGEKVREATTELAGLSETIQEFGPESRQGAKAIAKQKEVIGGMQRRFLGARLPGLQEQFDISMAVGEATGDYTQAAQDFDALTRTQEAYAQAARAERGGMRAGTQASRFMRGLIGGWGLMYMGHLAQFPMQQAQFGFAEAEQFQMGMAGYAGGQLGPGVQPFPAIQLQMQQAQLAYGGQGFGAFQAAQAGMPPLARDVAGMGLAGAAGGALSLYFGSVAQTAGLGGLGAGFTAFAPWAAGIGAAGYAVMQQQAWRAQPEQTTAAALIGLRAGGMGRGGARTIGEHLQIIGAGMRMDLGMTAETRERAERIDAIMASWEAGGRLSPSMLAPEDMPIAAQVFAGTMREGLDPTLGGQAYLRLAGIGATPQQIEDVVWAQMRGIETTGLAGGLLQAGRQRVTQAAAGELELQITSRIPDMYEAGEIQAGMQVMGNRATGWHRSYG